MQPSASTFKPHARATYTVRPKDIVQVLCHRQIDGNEQYLVRWRTHLSQPVPPRAICSWHALPELWHSLHHVQDYIEHLPNAIRAPSISNGAVASVNRKRKSPDSDSIGARDFNGGSSGLLTPQDSLVRSRSPSVIDLVTPEPPEQPGPNVYNGILEKKEGRIVAKTPINGVAVATVDARNLPTEEMRRVAARTPVIQGEKAIRAAFEDKLLSYDTHGLARLENTVDSSTPSLNFTFIRDYVLRDGVSGIPEEDYKGCTKCKADMGGGVGCEYSTLCDCLQFAAVDENALQRSKPEVYEVYMAAKDMGGFDTTGLPKRFPYRKPGLHGPQTLLPFYRESRHAIYECNRNCRCGPKCKTRLVQKGRKVPLVVFKTRNRGWGVYCDEDLIQGEFIDTYLGEVITDEECKKRESQVGAKSKASYLYSLDKFVGDQTPDGHILEEEDTLVVDGQYMGNVTRFINHSCEPNCRQYSVSYNKNDLRLFNLAFFAYEDIARGTELTFDYADKDEVELDEAVRRREAALADPNNHDSIPCNCGAPKCRGYLWD